ncbi:MAG: YdeI/OmpD-associated family protein [Aeromicrobium erythreum]
MDEAELLRPADAAGWHRWLASHNADTRGVWLGIPDRTAPGDDVLSYENAVCEALCWGWIDGQARSLGPDGSVIWFSPRRARSPWAASNKARLERLTAQGRMQPPGLAVVEQARSNGMWEVLDGPEALLEPPALTHALDAVPAARAFWDGLSASARKDALTRIAVARREATTAARIARVVEQCAAGERPDR